MASAIDRTIQLTRFGDADGLHVVDSPPPKAGPGQVRVRVLASSLNYTDVLIRKHLYPQTAAKHVPFVMGYDVVGEIDQLGEGVHDFKIGDRVADMGQSARIVPQGRNRRYFRKRKNCIDTKMVCDK